MKLIILLSLCLLIGRNAASKWESLEKLKETLDGYHAAAESALKSTENLIQNTTSNAASFMLSLDDLSIVKEVNALPEGDKCRLQFIDLKTLKNTFKLHFSKLEAPLIKMMSEIKIRFHDLKASLSVYQGLADGMWWACKVQGKECTEETKYWLEERIQSLMCKVVKNCVIKSVVKREVPLTCNTNQYEHRGTCYAMDSSVCDGACYKSNCRDEPSPGCTKYCVGGFHCRNLKCIELIKACDGIDDCGDGSDERDCKVPASNCTLEMGKFLCSDKRKCIDVAMSCDGHADCDDGSDEGGSCDSGDCGPECRAAGGVCLRTARGKICLSHCPPGTSETPDGCMPGPALPPHALAELLDDLPRKTSRYLAGYKLLQSRLVDDLVAAGTRVADCRGGSFGTVVRLSGYLTTERPHTTTHHHTTDNMTYSTTTQAYYDY